MRRIRGHTHWRSRGGSLRKPVNEPPSFLFASSPRFFVLLTDARVALHTHWSTREPHIADHNSSIAHWRSACLFSSGKTLKRKVRDETCFGHRVSGLSQRDGCLSR